MKPVKRIFHADRKIGRSKVEGHLARQVKDYKKVLRDLHPTARHITYVVNRSVDNRTWRTEFYID